MKWIKLKDRKPSKDIDGKKVLIFRIMNETQKSQATSIIDVAIIKHSNEDETWWMALPDEPQI